MLYIISTHLFVLTGEFDTDCFDELLTVVCVYVNVVVRVVVVIVLVVFVPRVNVLEQVSDLFVGGRERIVPVILFLVVLVLSAVLVLMLGNKRVCVDIFV